MNNFKIGINSKIDCNRVEIDDSVVVGDNVKIECEFIKLGKFSVIGDNVKITCRNFEADEWLYMCSGVEVGRGGCTGPNSNVKIGKHVGIFENTIINPSDSVEIGDDVGIGSEVMIWTHGAWLDILQGFPSDFGPVKIGNNVWLPARNIVLPNVTIGDNSVIGIGSIINKDIPAGSLAAGSPCKVIKENYYPRPLDEEQQKKLIWEIIWDWYELHEIKGIVDTRAKYDDGKIILIQQDKETIYYMEERKIEGYTNDVSEDLRDYLRRRGIKIYTDRLFKSI
jgi:acetyltransferase-like isoleucine patch superfamily enzyme